MIKQTPGNMVGVKHAEMLFRLSIKLKNRNKHKVKTATKNLVISLYIFKSTVSVVTRELAAVMF